MKTKFFLLGAASLLFASCSNELDVPVNQASVKEGTSPLSINVLANPTTKAQITGDKLPNGSKIGVTLEATGAVDGKYDNTTYNNIYYATTDGVAWEIDDTKKILLSATDGTVYGYYPYDPDVTDIENISINATDGTDYMYATPVSGIKNSNASAPLTMNHALSVVRFTIQKAAEGGYTGAGNITKVKLEGGTMGNTGSMNIKTQTVTATAGAMTYNSPLKLTPSAESETNQAQVFAVPTSTQSTIKFTVTMDGQDYTATTGEVTLAKGQQYKYTLNMSSTGLTVSTVSVNPWGAEQDKGELSPGLATLTDGVYAIKADGKPMAYDEAITTSESLTGVAFVLKGKAYQVARTEISSKWDNEDNIEIEGVTNYSNVDGTNGYGYLSGSSTPQLSTNYNTWIDGALGDFNGEVNTTAIIKGHSDGTLAGSLGKAVKDFREGDSNEGYTDWFVPACGELAYMFLQKDKLNTLLNQVSGTQFSTSSYWSSSEYSSNVAWYMSFSNGLVYNIILKNNDLRVRLVRAI